jgi:acyl-CoA thioester hydrolase
MAKNSKGKKTTSINEIENKIFNFEDNCRVKVRFNDTDAMGIVHFKNYMVYFDDGFVSFMRNIGLSRQFEKIVLEEITFGVKKVVITYHNSAKFGDFVIVKTKLKKIGNSTLTFDHQLFRESDEMLLAYVESVRFLMNMKTKKLMNALEFFTEYLYP